MKYYLKFLFNKGIKSGLLAILCFGILNNSCKKYVEIQGDSRYSRLETAADCQLLLDYSDVMNAGYPNDGELSADDAYLTDAGYSSADLDQTDRDLYRWVPNGIRAAADPQWQKAYYTVYYANLVLEKVEQLNKTSNDSNKLNSLRGSALFFRAFAFWHISQIYAKPYSSAISIEGSGIPLRLSSDINDKSVRSSVMDTYSQILSDLQESVRLLETTSLVATRPNKVAAYAMLARTYLSMEKFDEALQAATSALQIKSSLLTFSSLNASLPFSAPFNTEVIFHAVTTTGQAVNSARQGRIAPSLINQYDNNDLRKSIFFTSVGDGTYRFTGNYAGASFSTSQFNGLAVDELFLIRAECYARKGQVTEAMSDLNTLLRTRWNGNYTDMVASNADDALSKILTERRKELVMRGLRWTDLRRLNRDTRFAKTLTRTVTVGGVATTYILTPNDPRYTLLIPNEVIVNGGIPQNPR